MATPQILEAHLRKDHYQGTYNKDHYQGTYNIGRLYQPDDPNLSVENIVDTVLIEFSKLYKIYDLIKDR